MLDSHSEAEDAVQEARLRLARTEADAVHNLGGWLTTAGLPHLPRHAVGPRIAAGGPGRPLGTR
ncbi:MULTISPECIES: hypothetical protein [unclassified Streptomyces]|uniref:hypothetical protein n=1 Tax=unclassified Streptomyces TaxID=2593676 RepID=UPI0035D80CE0